MTTMPNISEFAKVYLLLTGRLAVGRGSRSDTSAPLNLREMNGLESRLSDLGHGLLDLTVSGSAELLNDLGERWDVSRMRGLLGRGMKISLAIEKWQQSAIWVLCRDDEDYPKCFKDRMGASAPPIIYGCGDIDLFDTEAIAIVGSRRADSENLKFARTAGRQSADAEFTVVSGGAKGVDQSAMGGVLDADGCAIAVLANGLSRAAIAPENRMLISDERLLLISPFDPDAGFSVGNAMGRNKLIFALGNAGLVVESDYETGGTWAGATEQLKRLRFVPVFVRATGTPSRGLDGLKGLGARTWVDPTDPDAARAIFEEIRSGVLETGEPSIAPRSLIESPQQAAMVMDPGETFGSDEEQTTTDQVEIERSDLFFSDVRRHIVGVLQKPKSRDEIASELGLIKRQTDLWLSLLVAEGTVLKLSEPVRYVRSE